MHRDAKTPLQASWNADAHTLKIDEPERGAQLRVRCDSFVAHESRDDGTHALRLRLPRREQDDQPVVVVLAAGWPEGPEAVAVTHRVHSHVNDLIDEALAHYEDLIQHRAPRVESPDPDVDRAIAWSAISLDQLRVKSPDLGYGLVSGYSSSGDTTRPRYCWFFEEPMLTQRAYHRLGLSSHVREAFELLMRYQREDGKTVHEVTQSLRWWKGFFEEFRYAYIHTDGAVYYLDAFARYWRETGDLDFVRAHWPGIAKIFSWCESIVDPKDALLRIDPGDWGSAESSFKVGKDSQLEAMWVRALRSVEDLARELGKDELAARCAVSEQRARISIEAKLWNEEAGTYHWGVDRAGCPLDSLVPHHAIGIWMDSFRPDRATRMLETMASADFKTDWGVRSLSLADKKYDAKSYQSGSVWPVWNTGVIIGDFRHLRCVEGFRNWRAMVALRGLDQLGPMPEVLSASECRRLPEGVPHQQFSECAVTNGFFDGLLGLEVDVPARRLRLAPWMPPTWPRLEVERIPFGPASIDIEILNENGRWSLIVQSRLPWPVDLDLAPRLPVGSAMSQETMTELEISCEASPTATVLRLHRRVKPNSQLRVDLPYEGGIEMMPVDEPITLGTSSRNLRLIRYTFQSSLNRCEMVVEGLPDRDYEIDFFFDGRFGHGVNIGNPLPIDGGLRLRTRCPDELKDDTMRSGYVRWRIVLKLEAF
jgi:hypothetical protein